MSFFVKKFNILLLAITLLTIASISALEKLDNAGGYNIVIAIEEGTPAPDNQAEFKSIIEDSVRRVSDKIQDVTRPRGLFIRSARVIIPSDWRWPNDNNLHPISRESYETADIRISSKVPRARVQNKNQCGRPGEYIEVPLNFFDKSEPYGTTWKSLMHLWARYRWGVWEEHGHPGDYRFPYFYKVNPDDSEWNTTGCANQPLTGDYEDISPSPKFCNTSSHPYPPQSTCRFRPDDTNTALTSLMHFPWVKSVVDFCDDGNHDIKSPNRHNLFCSYLSTSKIIETSEDMKPPSEPVSPESTRFDYYRSSARPFLYILLDNGMHLVPPTYFVLVKSGLKDLLDGRISENTMAKVDMFPQSTPPARPMPWTSIGNARLDFDRMINNHEPDIRGNRDFVAAIKKAVEEIYELNPVSGGVLVVLKTGMKIKFDETLSEQELVSIVKGRPVKIFAIEIEESNLIPRINLETVARESGGRHLRLTRNSNINAEVKSIIDEAVGVFMAPTVSTLSNEYILHKEYVVPGRVMLPPMDSIMVPLKFLLVTSGRINTNVQVPEGPLIPELDFKEGKEWGEAGSRSRNVYTATIDSLPQTLEYFEYICEDRSDPLGCDALLIIFGEDTTTTRNDVKIRISTSAQDYKLNLNEYGRSEIVKRAPLSIFAEVSERGVPLKGLKVIALVKQGPETFTISLRNNGQPPDLFQNDGIYSGVFVPLGRLGGPISVTVRLTYEQPSVLGTVNKWYTRLLPVSQDGVSCGGEESCEADAPERMMTRTWELLDFEKVVVSDSPFNFQPVPSQILDFHQITTNDFSVTLTWTAPYIIGSLNESESVKSYQLCHADIPEDVLNQSNCTDLDNPPEPLHPGEREIRFLTLPDQVVYFALTSITNDDKKSLLSNIVGVYPEEHPTPTTTTTTQRSTTTEAPPETTKGYHIVIAVDENSPVPTKMEEFQDRVLIELEKFSRQMHIITQQRFFVSSVEFIVPQVWNINATWTANSLKTAEIRISKSLTTPRVENPIPCGLPGNYMELPLSFFDTTNNAYGPELWKSVMNQWARYRWGVWEEHGYEGSQKFPYFHNYLQPGSTGFRATGCSYPQMEGDYLNVEGETCKLDPDYGYEPDCRFHPDMINPRSQSSLMYLPWVPGVEKFCDGNTHDKEAPNKQNLFCRHRSTFEVITRSLDLNKEDALTTIIHSPKIEFRKTTAKPLFYLLLDEGQCPIPQDGLNAIRTLLIKLFERLGGLEGTVAAIGKFPSSNPEGSYVEDAKSWAHISPEELDNFNRTIFSFPNPKSIFRDFGLAIHETVNKIKKMNLPNGAVILVVKTGVAPDSFHKMSYEEELISAVKQENIKIYVLEMRSSALRPQIHLPYLSEKSGGQHLAPNNSDTLPAIESSFIRSLVSELQEPTVEFPSASRVMYKGEISSAKGLNMKIAARKDTNKVANILVYLTARTGVIESVNVTLERRPYRFRTKREWLIKDEGNHRETFFGTRPTTNLGPSADFIVSFQCSPNFPGIPKPCSAYLVVEGELTETRTSDPFRVTISTSVSGLNNIVDLSEDRQSTTPFGVFVKIEEKNRTLKGILKVEAMFHLLEDNTQPWTIPLTDDGYGTPDIFRNDGIYSGNFIPPTDGTYSLFVNITHIKFHDVVPKSRLIHRKPRSVGHEHVFEEIDHDLNNLEGRLLPIDHKDTGCPTGHCNSKLPSQNFVRIVEYMEPIVFKNTNLWRDKTVPAQILDLSAWPLDGNTILLKWTTPFSIGNVDRGHIEADVFDLRVASELDELTESRFDRVPVADRIQIPNKLSAGEIQEYFFDSGESGKAYYFAIRGCIGDIGLRGTNCSRPSNIVGARTRNEQLTTPIEPTTTEETEETTTKTTPRPTTKPTIRTTTTTPKTTSTTAKPVLQTTEKVEYWFEKPEGYITLIAFGAGAIILGIGAAFFILTRNRKGTDMKRLIQN